MIGIALLLLSGSLFTGIAMATAGFASREKTDSLLGATIYALFQVVSSSLAILVIMKCTGWPH